MDSVINIDDCGTEDSIVVTSIIDGGEIIQALTDRILGRVIAEPIFDAEGKELFPVNTMRDEDALDVIDELNLSSLKIRSPMTCNALSEYVLCVTEEIWQEAILFTEERQLVL